MNKHSLSLGITSLIILVLSVACQGTPTPTPAESLSPHPSLTPVMVLGTVTSRQVGGDYTPIDITSQFSPTDVFYCVTQVADVEHDTQITARWYYDDALISEATYTTEDQGSGYVAFELTSQQPWPEGIYRVDVLSAGIIVDSVGFRVAK